MKKNAVFAGVLVGLAVALWSGWKFSAGIPKERRGVPPQGGSTPSDPGTPAETIAPAPQRGSQLGSQMGSQMGSSPSVSASAADRRKVQIFNEIMESRNDNDPRLDQDFNQLSPAAKALMRERYGQLALEKRNERGALVFLLGRNLSSDEDYAFVKQVLAEPVCRSLSNCGKDESSTHESAHHAAENELTLAYPQMVSVMSMEAVLSRPNLSPADRERAISVLRAAAQSPIPIVVNKAAEILKKAKF